METYTRQPLKDIDVTISGATREKLDVQRRDVLERIKTVQSNFESGELFGDSLDSLERRILRLEIGLRQILDYQYEDK